MPMPPPPPPYPRNASVMSQPSISPTYMPPTYVHGIPHTPNPFHAISEGFPMK
jgi:hypothetical protein